MEEFGTRHRQIRDSRAGEQKSGGATAMGAMMCRVVLLVSGPTIVLGIAPTAPGRLGLKSPVYAAAGQAASQKLLAVINGGLPSVSPDGHHIAIISNRGGAGDLFVIATDGTGELQLTQTPDEKGNLAWTAGGQVLFSVFAGDTSRLFAIDKD